MQTTKSVVLASAAALLLILTLSATAQNLELPDFGDPSVQYLGLEQERMLGAKVRKQLLEKGLIVDDPLLNEYLTAIGQRLASYADQNGNPYTFYWINAPSINAFAAPGGYIFVHTGANQKTHGMITGVQTDDWCAILCDRCD